MLEDRRVQLGEAGRRLEAELLAEHGSKALIGTQRIGLPPASIEREHQHRPALLTERLVANGSFGSGRDHLVLTEIDPSGQQRIVRRPPQLLDPRGLAVSPAQPDGVVQRRTAPSRQGSIQRDDRRRCVAAIERLATRGDVRLELGHVELARRDAQEVAVVAPQHAVTADHVAQHLDVTGQCRHHPGVVRIVPDVGEEPLRRDQLVRRDEQANQQRPPASAAYLDPVVGDGDLQRSEDAEPHALTLPWKALLFSAT